ncbi:MAG: glycosyltransferase family 1 protein [Myxococcota bacterium]
MRIALFTEVFLPKIDGITNRLRHTIRCLRDEGHEVLVFAPDCPMREYAGARIESLPAIGFPPYPGLRLGLPDPRSAWHLRRFAPHVVHAVGPAFLGVFGLVAARALALPTVASYHTDLVRYAPLHGLGWVEPALWPAIRAVHNTADLNLCPSRFTQRELAEHGVRDVGLWRGGVDVERFAPGRRSLALRMQWTGGRPERPVVLYAGRLSPEKGLDAFRNVLEACPGAQGVLVGDGPSRADLEASLGGLDVVFTGFLRGEALAAAFASADVFFMPSATETLGFVVLEAMASGVPVVAANAGGVPDLVAHGETGWLYEPDRPLDGARCVAELLREDGRRRQFALLARKRALEQDWPSETRRLVETYRRAICGATSGGPLRRLHRAFVGG